MSQAESHTTVDHDEIRRWCEARKGKPSEVKRTEGKGGEPGILRIDFPGFSGAGSLEEITWDQFFKKFDESKLAFLFQEKTADGKKSNFNKLIKRTSKMTNSGEKPRARSGSTRSRSTGTAS